MSAQKKQIFNPSDIVDSFTGRKRVRRSFGKIPEVSRMPNLIEIQKKSYDEFLQADTPADEREMRGLQEVLSSVFPINDFNGQAEMLAFWSQRPPEHITRHLCCTPFLTELNADSAKAITQVTLYQAEKGDSPVATINNPAAIIEFHDSFVKTDVGWKIAHRRGVPVLMFA